MATYSINVTTPYQSTFLGNLDPNLFLNNLPNNTAQLIVPEDLRDAVYTIWENVSFKRITATGSSTSFIGIGGQNHTDEYLSGADGLKLLLGKPELSGSETMLPTLIDYSSSDTDLFIYNLKADNFGGGGADQQLTKMTFLAGDNSNDLFLTSPYLMAQQRIGGTAVDFTIYNEAGKITIDSDHELIIGSPNTVITLLYGTGSTGIGNKPGGLPGDVQLNLDNCEFGFVNGASGSPGDFLVLGASNQPYWGGVSIGSLFTWNQVLTAGNTSDGEDVIITDSDSLYIGNTQSRFYYNGTYSSLSTTGELRVGATQFRLDVTGIGANKVLLTDGVGYAYWGTQSFGTGSSPHGNIGDVQLSGGSIFSSVNGLSGSVGEVLILGTANTPYWGTQSLEASGLEEVSEGGNLGWRLIGRDPLNYGNIGEGAIDFSLSSGTSSTRGSTGDRSVTFGLDNTNPYNDTFMFGKYILGTTTNTNSGSNIILSDGYSGEILQTFDNIYNSVIGAYRSSIGSSGGLSTAVIYESLAFGWGLEMYAGRGSAQIGYGLKGGAATCTIVGQSNIDITANITHASSGTVTLYNPRFIVGVGQWNTTANTPISRKNGFVVMSDGSVSAPELTVAKINAEGTYSLITLEYLEQAVVGLSASPGGVDGDIQINNGGTSFGFVNGASGSVNDVLIMGTANQPYWDTQSDIFTEHTPHAYIGRRYKFTDTDIHGFYYGISANERSGVDVWNDHAGTSATTGFVASIDQAPFTNGISMQFFGLNYYVPQLAGKGAIYSTNDITNMAINNSDFSWRSGTLITNTLEVMRLDTSGLLTLPQVSIAEINAGSSYSVITKEYLQTFTVSVAPAGNIGDVQISGGSVMDSVNGSSASIGDTLIMGATNSPYWGDSSETLQTVTSRGDTTTYSITADGLISTSGATVSGELVINAPAIGGREDIMLAQVTDNTDDKFIIANGTTTGSRFIPTFVGFVNGAYQSIIFRGLGLSANDTVGNASIPYMEWVAANTSSSSDPNNGTLTPPTNKILFSWGTTTPFRYMWIDASGELTVNNNAKINGIISASMSIPDINTTGTQSLITKEYLDAYSGYDSYVALLTQNPSVITATQGSLVNGKRYTIQDMENDGIGATGGTLSVNSSYEITTLEFDNTTSQISGTLSIGTLYRVDTFGTGDDFTNVGYPYDFSGNIFRATGITPSVWANSSDLYLSDDFGNVGNNSLLTDTQPPFIATASTPTYWGGETVVYETDNFFNIGFLSLTQSFIATGNTPSLWTNETRVYNSTDSPPTVKELSNQFGGTVSWHLEAVNWTDKNGFNSLYYGVFPENVLVVDKTIIFPGNYSSMVGGSGFVRSDASVISTTFISDDNLNELGFEVRVYT